MKKKLSELRVIDLKFHLEKRGLEVEGLKAALVERLAKAVKDEGNNPHEIMFDIPDEIIKHSKKSLAASKDKARERSEKDNNPEIKKEKTVDSSAIELQKCAVVLEESLKTAVIEWHEQKRKQVFRNTEDHKTKDKKCLFVQGRKNEGCSSSNNLLNPTPCLSVKSEKDCSAKSHEEKSVKEGNLEVLEQGEKRVEKDDKKAVIDEEIKYSQEGEIYDIDEDVSKESVKKKKRDKKEFLDILEKEDKNPVKEKDKLVSKRSEEKEADSQENQEEKKEKAKKDGSAVEKKGKETNQKVDQEVFKKDEATVKPENKEVLKKVNKEATKEEIKEEAKKGKKAIQKKEEVPMVECETAAAERNGRAAERKDDEASQTKVPVAAKEQEGKVNQKEGKQILEKGNETSHKESKASQNGGEEISSEEVIETNWCKDKEVTEHEKELDMKQDEKAVKLCGNELSTPTNDKALVEKGTSNTMSYLPGRHQNEGGKMIEEAEDNKETSSVSIVKQNSIDIHTRASDCSQPKRLCKAGENLPVAKKDEDAGNKTSESPRALWITGVSKDTKATDLKHFFSKHGKVRSARVITNSKAPFSNCYGHVVMSSSAEATACVKHFHRTILNGHAITVEKTRCEKLWTISRPDLKNLSQIANPDLPSSNESNCVKKFIEGPGNDRNSELDKSLELASRNENANECLNETRRTETSEKDEALDFGPVVDTTEKADTVEDISKKAVTAVDFTKKVESVANSTEKTTKKNDSMEDAAEEDEMAKDIAQDDRAVWDTTEEGKTEREDSEKGKASIPSTAEEDKTSIEDTIDKEDIKEDIGDKGKTKKNDSGEAESENNVKEHERKKPKNDEDFDNKSLHDSESGDIAGHNEAKLKNDLQALDKNIMCKDSGGDPKKDLQKKSNENQSKSFNDLKLKAVSGEAERKIMTETEQNERKRKAENREAERRKRAESDRSRRSAGEKYKRRRSRSKDRHHRHSSRDEHYWHHRSRDRHHRRDSRDRHYSYHSKERRRSRSRSRSPKMYERSKSHRSDHSPPRRSGERRHDGYRKGRHHDPLQSEVIRLERERVRKELLRLEKEAEILRLQKMKEENEELKMIIAEKKKLISESELESHTRYDEFGAEIDFPDKRSRLSRVDQDLSPSGSRRSRSGAPPFPRSEQSEPLGRCSQDLQHMPKQAFQPVDDRCPFPSDEHVQNFEEHEPWNGPPNEHLPHPIPVLPQPIPPFAVQPLPFQAGPWERFPRPPLLYGPGCPPRPPPHMPMSPFLGPRPGFGRPRGGFKNTW